MTNILGTMLSNTISRMNSPLYHADPKPAFDIKKVEFLQAKWVNCRTAKGRFMGTICVWPDKLRWDELDRIGFGPRYCEFSQRDYTRLPGSYIGYIYET